MVSRETIWCLCSIILWLKFAGLQGSSILGTSSVVGSSRMDHSYVVLPKQRNQTTGVPPRPRSGTMHPDAGKAIDESFVVLPPPAASVYKCEPGADGGGTNLPSPEGGSSDSPAQPHNSGFHSTITVLNRAFDIAKSQTQVYMFFNCKEGYWTSSTRLYDIILAPSNHARVKPFNVYSYLSPFILCQSYIQVEQPLCLECMRVLSDKLDKEVEDVNRDINAYESCLQRLEGESKTVLSEAEFLKEKFKVFTTILENNSCVRYI